MNNIQYFGVPKTFLIVIVVCCTEMFLLFLLLSIFSQKLQAEVRAKEIEIDSLMERSQHLYKGSTVPRSFSVTEIGQKYHQISAHVKVCVGH